MNSEETLQQGCCGISSQGFNCYSVTDALELYDVDKKKFQQHRSSHSIVQKVLTTFVRNTALENWKSGQENQTKFGENLKAGAWIQPTTQKTKHFCRDEQV